MTEPRSVAQPHPEFALNEDGWPAWNTPERRRRSFHHFAGFSRWGIRIRAARVRALPRAIDYRIGELPTVGRLLAMPMFSALAVVRDGELVYERYAADFPADRAHSVQSISKTTLALVAGRLVREGTLDLGKTVAEYIPEIGSGYATATIQQVLDMDVVNDYVEDTTNPFSDVFLADVVNGYRIPAAGEQAPTMAEFLCRITSDDIRNPSGETHYKSANSDLLAWIVERASGRAMREYLVEIADAAGIEHTLFVTTDRTFQPEISGGLQFTARDLARYGMLILSGGIGINGEVVGDKAFLDAARDGGGTTLGDGLRYHNQLSTNGRWIGHGGYGGQWLVVDEPTNSVIAFFSVLETVDGTDQDYASLRIAMSDEIHENFAV